MAEALRRTLAPARLSAQCFLSVSIMPIRIAALSDTHFADAPAQTGRRSDISDILLLRAAHRLNRFIKPDVTLILGDVINDGRAATARECLRRMRAVVDVLESPVIVIPGNHDGDPDAFYKVFDRPPVHVDVKGVRFVWFLDPEEPNWNARRTTADIERMAAARAGHDGPIVALQHVPVFPPGCGGAFNYTNAEEVIAAMRVNGIGLAISGHDHQGMDLVRSGSLGFLAAPALCEAEFSFLEITVDGDRIDVRRHDLRMPAHLRLVDCHVHTQFAYCGENMDIAQAMALADDLGLAGIGFAEHSGHLYFDAETYRQADFLTEGADYPKGRRDRMAEYFAAAKRADCPARRIGLEADCDFLGRPVVRAEDRLRAGFLIGAVHSLAELQKPQQDIARVSDEFLATTEKFVTSGIRVLAHPFRVFRRAGLETPASLFEPVARMLRRAGVAAEVNFHSNEPAPEFVRLCLDAGVRLSFGSDAHNLYEVGEFAPHLELLASMGFDGDLRDILMDPTSA